MVIEFIVHLLSVYLKNTSYQFSELKATMLVTLLQNRCQILRCLLDAVEKE